MADPIARAVFGLLFETSSEALLIVDRDRGVVVSANVRAAELLAHEVDTLQGMQLSDLMFEPGRELSGPGQYEEVALRRHDDYPVFVTLNVSFVDDPEHGALSACTARDTTERRQLERELFAKHSALFSAHADLEAAYVQLRETKQQVEDRNREIALLAWRAAVGELVAGFAHHLNNPVGALTSTLRRATTTLATLPHEVATTRAELERMLARAGKIAARIESNVDAIVKASHTAAGPQPRSELPHELAAALSSFVESLDDIPTKEQS